MKRESKSIGRTRGSCSLCGHGGLVLVESQAVRRGISRLHLGFDPRTRMYEKCGACGAKHSIERVA